MRINSKKVTAKHLEDFNLIQFLHDNCGIIINKAMEKSLKAAIATLLMGDLASLWKYPESDSLSESRKGDKA